MYKSHGIENQFHIREKGTNVWLLGSASGKPFYTYEDAQRWLRTEVRRLVEHRDKRSYTNRLTRKELIAECERFEIVEMQVTPVSGSMVQNPAFEQARIDAYRDGYRAFEPEAVIQRPDFYTTRAGISKEWFDDGYWDAACVHHGDDPVYPELASLI